jgi:hypothetical protein
MPEVPVVCLPSGRAAEILRELIDGLPAVQLTVTGDCMEPRLPEGAAVRLVARAERPPRLGDVVLVRHPSGLRLHRLVWGPPLARRRWRTKGDRSLLWDPAVGPEDVLATVPGATGRGNALGRAVLALVSLGRGLWARLRLRADALPARDAAA